MNKKINYIGDDKACSDNQGVLLKKLIKYNSIKNIHIDIYNFIIKTLNVSILHKFIYKKKIEKN